MADNREEQDPIAYTRAHTTSPAVHALLDEVERGRARRRGRTATRRIIAEGQAERARIPGADDESED